MQMARVIGSAVSKASTPAIMRLKDALAWAKEKEAEEKKLAAKLANPNERNDKPASVQDGAEVSEPNTNSPEAMQDFQVGDIVKTIAKKEKDKWHNMNAEIVTILKSHYRVKMLEGPAKYEEKKFMKECVTRVLKRPAPAAKPQEEDDPEKRARKLFADDLTMF